MGTPIGVEVSLINSTVTLGEPVVLHCKITNSTDTEMGVYTGRDNSGLSIELTDAMGRSTQTIADPRLPEGGLRRVNDGARISASSVYERDLVLTQQFLLTHPGQYQITVHVRLPYGAETQNNFIVPRLLEQTYGTVLTQDFSLPLTITPRNPAQLRSIAEGLHKSIVGSAQGGYVEKNRLIEELFSIPQQYVLSDWQALARDPKLGGVLRDKVASELARVNSVAAADILADMIWNPAQPPAARVDSQVGNYLHNMRFQQSADPLLKQHVDKLFTDHGHPAPDRPITNLD